VIVSVGLDFAEVERVRGAIRRHPRIVDRLFTPKEQATSRRRADPAPSFAARFAAKEAAMKALGTGWSRGIRWLDIEVTGGGGAPPGLAFHGEAEKRLREIGASRAHLSLTHERTMAGAVVILEV
jgi:holo-[acyl-carrier protein] synthase